LRAERLLHGFRIHKGAFRFEPVAAARRQQIGSMSLMVKQLPTQLRGIAASGRAIATSV
jgi:hypothetical protein